jgi:Carboxypeptidase regulatory-like domain/TonB-dependent Receptor Plug Domain/TonB dependent receptor
MPTDTLRRAALPALLALALAAPRLPAQAPETGTVEGTVVDAATLLPLPSAHVSVRAMEAGREHAAVTDASGAYRFGALPPGLYQVTARRIGYHPASFQVRIDPRIPARVSVGLPVEPLLLQPLTAGGAAGNALERRESAGDDDAARADAQERLRRRSLAGDAAAVTAADVRDAPALGESDVLRAVLRLPGVSARDDYATEPWTRGAPWSQTTVFFDGVPLFNPFHAAGALSTIPAEVLSDAVFLPGVQPAELAAGGAGALDLRTRTAARGPRATAEASVAGARASVAVEHGPLGVVAAARRTHLDVLAGVPFGFVDGAARADLRLGRGWVLEASGLRSVDWLDGALERFARAEDAWWSTSAGRLTLAAPLGSGTMRVSAGGSRSALFSSRPAPAPLDTTMPQPEPPNPALGPPIFEQPPPPRVYEDLLLIPRLDNATAYLFGSAVWEGGPWEAGVRVWRHGTRWMTWGEWPYRSNRGLTVFPYSGDQLLPAGHEGRLDVAAAWAERRWRVGSRAEVQAGVRAELAGRGLGPRLAPRGLVRWEAAEGVTLSAGAARSHQYAQALVPGHSGLAQMVLGHAFWTVAGGEMPVLRADVATAGAEAALGGGVTGGVSLFARRTAGMALPDSGAGTLEERPPFVAGRGRAHGVEVWARRPEGRWTGSASYSYVRSRLEVQGVEFRAPTGRPHVLLASGFVHLGGGARAGGMLTVAGGSPVTRYFHYDEARCRSAGATCPWRLPAAGSPSRERSPLYQGLDLSLDWSGRVGRARTGAQLQVRNVLGRKNPGGYRETDTLCEGGGMFGCVFSPIDDPTDQDAVYADRHLPGLPRLPMLRLWMSL